jgi:hypothetical protein
MRDQDRPATYVNLTFRQVDLLAYITVRNRAAPGGAAGRMEQ